MFVEGLDLKREYWTRNCCVVTSANYLGNKEARNSTGTVNYMKKIQYFISDWIFIICCFVEGTASKVFG